MSDQVSYQRPPSFPRIFKAGWISFRRNSFLSLGTTGVMTLALLVIAGLMALSFITGQIVSTLEEKVDISVYFREEAKEEQILKIKSDLEFLESVRVVAYVSKEQALEDFKSRHQTDQLIQESIAELDFNPLQASLNIKAVEAGQYAAIAQFLEKNYLQEAIDKVNFYENELAISRIQGITRGLNTGGLFVSLFLVLVAVLVIFNTIRLAIFSQKPEIEVMRLVGASNWHVRGPFLVEGGLYGLWAAAAALLIFYPAIYFSSSKIVSFAPQLNLAAYFSANWWQMVIVLVVLGLVLGISSSTIAIRRYLQI